MCTVCDTNNSVKGATDYTINYFDVVERNDLTKAKPSLERQKEYAKKGLLVESVISLPDDPSQSRIFDAVSYKEFLGEGKERPETIHPTLWEHAKLNMNVGLFRTNNIEKKQAADDAARKNKQKFIAEKGDVFQIRGYDLANMTLLRGETGWIIMDVLTTSETAAAALQFAKAQLGELPVKAVIYSHSHVDHYGGIGGVLQGASNVAIIAPENFLVSAVSENVYAGNAMNSRAVFMYGSMLEHSPTGQVDAGLGKATAVGTRTLVAPTVEIKYSDADRARGYSEMTVDGLLLQFQLTPGTEAPSEMNVYVPSNHVLFIAENCTGTLHNLYTLRGAEVRDPLAWADFLDQTIMAFAQVEIVCSSHNWPHFNTYDGESKLTKNDCLEYLELQRDVYRYLANTTLSLINQGYTIEEVGRKMETLMPDAIHSEWCNHGFYGTINHNAKAIYQRYIGWYDGNPSNLNKLIPTEAATRYVACMGGMQKVTEFAKTAIDNGEYAWAAELLNRAIFAVPINADEEQYQTQARLLNADALEQLGYQSESGPWRNEYLTAAKLLRAQASGLSPLPTPVFTLDKSIVDAMTPEMLMQYAGIMFDGYAYNENDNSCTGTITFIDENSGKIYMWVNRGVLNYRQGAATGTPEFTLNTTKYDFYRMLIERTVPTSGVTDTQGRLKSLLAHMTVFKGNFNIISP